MTGIEHAPAATRTETIEVFWQPGCSSCLRMKEFVEKTGVPYEEVNIAAQPERVEKLRRLGLYVPAVCVGERGVTGVDLKAVAGLMGFPYDAPAMLAPEDLRAKYNLVIPALQRFVAQIPPDGLLYKSPDRDRTFLNLANHAASVMRSYLRAYDDDVFDTSFYGEPPAHIRTTDDIVARAGETIAAFEEWWERAGQYDPHERVVETYWGHRTLHEVLEREVWHTAQHTRQVMMFLSDRLNVPVNGPLTAEDLAGLPLPDRVWN